jgi:putative MFS transporter
MNPSNDPFAELIDRSRLSVRYWTTGGLLMLGLVGELYDFFIAGFIVSAVAPAWGLTFGQSAAILVAVGLGAIAGSLALGRLADQIGRKVTLVAGGLMCSAAAGAIALLPDHAWIAFALLRFLVGFGYGGASATQLALFVEFTPTRHRTLLSSLILAPVAGGMLLAALVFATLSPALGWRGVAALGVAPAVVSCLLWAVCPESVRWLASKGRIDEARLTLAKFLGRPLEEVPAPTGPAPAASSARLAELARDPRRFWLVVLVYFGFNVTITGCYLTGPVIVAQLLGIPPRQAALQFVYVSLVGAVGRAAFSVLPHRLGRVRAGQIAAFGAALAMAGAALFHASFIGTVPVFLLFLIGGALFWDGGVSAISPYAAEVFPVRMAARGMGLGQAAGGLGKFVGPAVLALIAGSGNLITPQTTADAVTPSFLFLAACVLVTGLAFVFLGVEPHGKALSLA